VKKQSDFVTRTITGAVFVAVILASMLSFWSFWGVMSLVLILTLFEFKKLLNENGTTEQKESLRYSLFAYLYIMVPFVCLIYLYHLDFFFALLLFIFIWINDTFAYLVGITIGKHKLWPKISPKKSWEGFFGGLVFTILSAVLFCYLLIGKISGEIYLCTECENVKSLSFYMLNWIIFAIIVVIAGTFGDLFESYLKRSLNVKDSGTILPGHGGLLDRFDSVLFAAPAAMVYLMLIL
jgi:phosphatidate cytidylyltransferase